MWFETVDCFFSTLLLFPLSNKNPIKTQNIMNNVTPMIISDLFCKTDVKLAVCFAGFDDFKNEGLASVVEEPGAIL